GELAVEDAAEIGRDSPEQCLGFGGRGGDGLGSRITTCSSTRCFAGLRMLVAGPSAPDLIGCRAQGSARWARRAVAVHAGPLRPLLGVSHDAFTPDRDAVTWDPAREPARHDDPLVQLTHS